MNKGIPESIAFSALCISCAAMEFNGVEVGALWVVIAFWAIFSDWGRNEH